MPWLVVQRIMYFLDTETKLQMSKLCKTFNYCLFTSEAWSEIDWHHKVFPPALIKVVRESGRCIETFTCSSTAEKEPFSMDLNKVLFKLIKLRVMRLKKCTLVYNWAFLCQTNNITHMFVDECIADPTSMIAGLNALANLKHLELTRCRLMAAYNICQGVKYCLKLQYLDVRGSGKMKSVLACVVLNKCTALKTFLFSNLYTYDTMYDRLRWFRITRMKFKHVTFAEDLQERVAFYTRTDLAVRQLLNIGQMLDKYGPREE